MLLEEPDLRSTIHLASVLELAGETLGAECRASLVQIVLVLGRQVSGRHKPCCAQPWPRAQPRVRVAQNVEPFLRRDAREVADRERIAAARDTGTVALDVDADRDDVHLLGRDSEVPTA